MSGNQTLEEFYKLLLKLDELEQALGEGKE